MTIFAEKLAEAIRGHRPLPDFNESMTLEDGYELQKEVANLVSPIGFAGIKAGVTSRELQQAFGINHPLLGRLYEQGRLTSGARIKFIDNQIIECEIGITVNSKGELLSAGLALEFAFAAFSSPKDATAPNLVAANVAADKFLLGPLLPLRDSYDDVTIKLFRNNALINEAPITESLGGPIEAVKWIVKEARKYNIKLFDTALLMTGACGQVVPALPGNYRANYGTLGEVNFTIIE